MQAEGVVFRPGTHVGRDVSGEELRQSFEAIVLAGGAEVPRDLPVPGRELRGVHFAMEFLVQQNRRGAGDLVPEQLAILATGKHVVILGGGDTGSDCLGTSLRQGAREVTQIELFPEPPHERLPTNPWPAWPIILRKSSSQEEGGTREWAMMTTEFLGNERGELRALRGVRVALEAGRPQALPGTEFELECELVLLAMGFVGSPRAGLLTELGVEFDARGNVQVSNWQTNVPGVFATGDQARGQSLVVWAIADGRRCAEAADAYLDGRRHLAVAVGEARR